MKTPRRIRQTLLKTLIHMERATIAMDTTLNFAVVPESRMMVQVIPLGTNHRALGTWTSPKAQAVNLILKDPVV
jgi:hypothetical protein